MKVKRVYCHFSFRRPRGKDYGLFAVAFYWDYDGTKLITKKVRKIKLWDNQQFISAIQSYENALRTIHEYQGQMIKAGIKQVMLVTDNSILAGWIEDPNKNKYYTPYMERAIKNYRIGEPKELVIGVGLCKVREYEKSYKYCKEELVDEDETVDNIYRDGGNNKIKIDNSKSALDIVNEDLSIPDIEGIKEL